MSKIVYVVGTTTDGKEWMIEGVFSEESRAREVAIERKGFVGPLELDVPTPVETTKWPKAYYPASFTATARVAEEIMPRDLANWLRKYGAESYWSVDGDPDLTGKINFPCTTEELATELEKRDNSLLRYSSSWHVPEDAAGNRVLQLSWKGVEDPWLLIEDKETASVQKEERLKRLHKLAREIEKRADEQPDYKRGALVFSDGPVRESLPEIKIKKTKDDPRTEERTQDQIDTLRNIAKHWSIYSDDRGLASGLIIDALDALEETRNDLEARNELVDYYEKEISILEGNILDLESYLCD